MMAVNMWCADQKSSICLQGDGNLVGFPGKVLEINTAPLN